MLGRCHIYGVCLNKPRCLVLASLLPCLGSSCLVFCGMSWPVFCVFVAVSWHRQLAVSPTTKLFSPFQRFVVAVCSSWRMALAPTPANTQGMGSAMTLEPLASAPREPTARLVTPCDWSNHAIGRSIHSRGRWPIATAVGALVCFVRTGGSSGTYGCAPQT